MSYDDPYARDEGIPQDGPYEEFTQRSAEWDAAAAATNEGSPFMAPQERREYEQSKP